MIDNPVNFSKQTKKEATDILRQTNLIGHLSVFGDVRIGGSFYTDLMFGPDIDITVATKNPRESAVGFLENIISKQIFQKHEYGDFESFPREKRPQSHIVNLSLLFAGRRWEIEIWFFKEHRAEQLELEKSLKNLDDDIKANILKAKAEREQSGVDKHKLSSYEIYQQYL